MANSSKMLTIAKAIEQLEALGLPKRDPQTIKAWVKEFKLGRKMGGSWIVFEDKWNAWLTGELDEDKNGKN